MKRGTRDRELRISGNQHYGKKKGAPEGKPILSFIREAADKQDFLEDSEIFIFLWGVNWWDKESTVGIGIRRGPSSVMKHRGGKVLL